MYSGGIFLFEREIERLRASSVKVLPCENQESPTIVHTPSLKRWLLAACRTKSPVEQQ